uniref:Uncharacterized protein n=1 Tax=Arundo donax TaxID=35708 RepID=A0A0A8Y2T3_ARUDO
MSTTNLCPRKLEIDNLVGKKASSMWIFAAVLLGSTGYSMGA